MKFSRRNFVKLGGAAALGGIGLSKIALGQQPVSDIFEELSADSFRGFFKTEFILSNDQVSIPAKLVKVADLAPASKSGKCFSLVFETSGDGAQEGTYYVFSPETGNFELFLTEGRIGKSNALVAIINRI